MAHLKRITPGYPPFPGLLKNASGHLVKTCQPCTYCGEDGDDYVQPSVIVTENAPAGNCNQGGTYAFDGYAGPSGSGGVFCMWEWDLTPNPSNWPVWYVWVFYYIATNTFKVMIDQDDGVYCTTPYLCDPCTTLHCNEVTHELEGTVTLIGQKEGELSGVDCIGYTATATFG